MPTSDRQRTVVRTCARIAVAGHAICAVGWLALGHPVLAGVYALLTVGSVIWVVSLRPR